MQLFSYLNRYISSLCLYTFSFNELKKCLIKHNKVNSSCNEQLTSTCDSTEDLFKIRHSIYGTRNTKFENKYHLISTNTVCITNPIDFARQMCICPMIRYNPDCVSPLVCINPGHIRPNCAKMWRMKSYFYLKISLVSVINLNII